jgi:hypothetical protein
MLTLLAALAFAQSATDVARAGVSEIAFEGPITVTLRGVAVPDAEVRLYDPAGRLVAGPFVTDPRGEVVIDGTITGARTVHVRRVFRFQDGDRPLFVAELPASPALQDVDLASIDTGSGPIRATPRAVAEARDLLKLLKKRRVDIEAACRATLDVASVEEARAGAEAQIGPLMIGGGSGFEACVARAWATAPDVGRAEQITHYVDAVGGRTSERLWNGLASAGFAEWSFEHGQFMRAQRASGAATERLAGVIGSDAGHGDGEAARPLLARSYLIEAHSAMIQGDVPAAVSKYHQAMRVYKQVGNPTRILEAKIGIARAEIARGRRDAAREQLVDADPLAHSPAWRVAVAHLRSNVDADPIGGETVATLLPTVVANPGEFDTLLCIGAWWGDAGDVAGRSLLDRLAEASSPDQRARVEAVAARLVVPEAPPPADPPAPTDPPAPSP